MLRGNIATSKYWVAEPTLFLQGSFQKGASAFFQSLMAFLKSRFNLSIWLQSGNHLDAGHFQSIEYQNQTFPKGEK